MADELELVVRASEYQSRMLPNLLMDLFGSGVQSSQIALSCVTPELLAAAEAAEMGTNGGRMPASTSQLAYRVRWMRLPLRRKAAVAGAALGLLALILLLILRPGNKPAPLAQPTVAAPALVAPPPAPAPLPAALPAAPPQALPEKAIDPASSKTKKSVAKRTKGSAQGHKNPIADGLSIDPFAEAAARGKP
jgi:hypothetical protein